MFDKLVDLIIQFAELFQFWTVLEPFEAGVKTRLGKFVKVLEPGFHWVAPFRIERTATEHTVPTTQFLRDQSVTTADGKQLVFQAIITYQVRDIQKCLLEVSSAEHAIQDSCAGTIAHELSRSTYREIIEVDETIDKVTAACRKRGFKWGLEVTSVQFSTIVSTKTLRLMTTVHDSYVPIAK
jgi:regulator of protease activity HflC (stomatin/prohibitin superfamily)